MATKNIRIGIQTLSITLATALALCLGSGCASADTVEQEELGEHRAALEVEWWNGDQLQFDSNVAELEWAVVEASRVDQQGDIFDIGRIDQVAEAPGQDFPGKDCIRNDSEESSTSGKCENVCKDKEVYSPHPSEDPAGTFGVCKGETKKKE